MTNVEGDALRPTSGLALVAGIWGIVAIAGCDPRADARSQRGGDTSGPLSPPSRPPRPARAAPAVANIRIANADSIVLERTPCFGSCPAYRLRISRDGGVLFHSRNAGDADRTEVGSVSARQLEHLLMEFELLGFAELPDTIANSREYCGSSRTDAATVITTVFAGATSKQVVDYHGCQWAPSGLRELETLVDSIVNTRRWIRPSASRAAPRPSLRP